MRMLLFILLISLLLGCKQKEVPPLGSQTLAKAIKQTHKAGDTIVLTFPAREETAPTLLVNYALGSTVLKGKKSGNEWQYAWPDFLSQKSGFVSWVLLQSKEPLPSGHIVIEPNDARQNLIETYLGPKSIRAGGVDESMLVALPTDPYDNLLPEESSLRITHQLGALKETDTLQIRKGLVWKKLYGSRKAGILLASASYENSQSKELSVQVLPANAENFAISYDRLHAYADGHQLLTLRTSIIKDEFGNPISDGTLVNFVAQNTVGGKLNSMGKTIGGIATAQFLHPENPQTWEIYGHITGIAQSNALQVEFKAAFADFQMAFSKDNRMITLGPVRSFMGQLIPDGMRISMRIQSPAGTVHNLETSTRNGIGQMILAPDVFPAGAYTMELEIGGVFKRITLNVKDGQEE
ncbi:MAG: hypothetical protein KJP14_05880 [Eudoraea sp.]|nr:hypothetical protein [Eudoraea sp.]